MEQIEINVTKNIEEVEINVQPNVTQVIISENIGSGIQSVQAGENVTVDNTDPQNPIINVPDIPSGGVESVTGNIVDNTDPDNPTVNFNAGDYDLENFNNESSDPFVRESELPSVTPTLQQVLDQGKTADFTDPQETEVSINMGQYSEDSLISLISFAQQRFFNGIEQISRFELALGICSISTNIFNEDTQEQTLGGFGTVNGIVRVYIEKNWTNSSFNSSLEFEDPDEDDVVDGDITINFRLPKDEPQGIRKIATREWVEAGITTDFVTIDPSATGQPETQGTMAWDVDNETVSVILNGYKMLIGEDQFYPVKNQTGSTITKGTNVKFAGTLGASGRLLIAPFIADGTDPSYVYMGVTAEDILNGEDGKVLWFGRLRGINTNAFDEGDILYASTTSAGGFQTAIPTGSNNVVQVAAVINKSSTQGVIFIRPQIEPLLVKPESITTATTGSDISFTTPQVYNSPSSPSTSNLTNTLTGARIGVIQKIYHNNATAPTVPAGWILIGGSYATSELNIIYAEFVSGSRVEYWITQEQ